MKNGDKWQAHIFCDPKMMGGEPVIKGTRITVAVVVGSLADGMSIKEILKAFPKIGSSGFPVGKREAFYRETRPLSRTLYPTFPLLECRQRHGSGMNDVRTLSRRYS